MTATITRRPYYKILSHFPEPGFKETLPAKKTPEIPQEALKKMTIDAIVTTLADPKDLELLGGLETLKKEAKSCTGEERDRNINKIKTYLAGKTKEEQAAIYRITGHIQNTLGTNIMVMMTFFSEPLFIFSSNIGNIPEGSIPPKKPVDLWGYVKPFMSSEELENARTAGNLIRVLVQPQWMTEFYNDFLTLKAKTGQLEKILIQQLEHLCPLLQQSNKAFYLSYKVTGTQNAWSMASFSQTGIRLLEIKEKQISRDWRYPYLPDRKPQLTCNGKPSTEIDTFRALMKAMWNNATIIEQTSFQPLPAPPRLSQVMSPGTPLAATDLTIVKLPDSDDHILDAILLHLCRIHTSRPEQIQTLLFGDPAQLSHRLLDLLSTTVRLDLPKTEAEKISPEKDAPVPLDTLTHDPDFRRAVFFLRQRIMDILDTPGTLTLTIPPDTQNKADYLASYRRYTTWIGLPELEAAAHVLKRKIVILIPRDSSDGIYIPQPHVAAFGQEYDANGVIYPVYNGRSHYTVLLAATETAKGSREYHGIEWPIPEDGACGVSSLVLGMLAPLLSHRDLFDTAVQTLMTGRDITAVSQCRAVLEKAMTRITKADYNFDPIIKGKKKHKTDARLWALMKHYLRHHLAQTLDDKKAALPPFFGLEKTHALITRLYKPGVWPHLLSPDILADWGHFPVLILEKEETACTVLYGAGETYDPLPLLLVTTATGDRPPQFELVWHKSSGTGAQSLADTHHLLHCLDAVKTALKQEKDFKEVSDIIKDLSLQTLPLPVLHDAVRSLRALYAAKTPDRLVHFLLTLEQSRFLNARFTGVSLITSHVAALHYRNVSVEKTKEWISLLRNWLRHEEVLDVQIREFLTDLLTLEKARLDTGRSGMPWACTSGYDGDPDLLQSILKLKPETLETEQISRFITLLSAITPDAVSKKAGLDLEQWQLDLLNRRTDVALPELLALLNTLRDVRQKPGHWPEMINGLYGLLTALHRWARTAVEKGAVSGITLTAPSAFAAIELENLLPALQAAQKDRTVVLTAMTFRDINGPLRADLARQMMTIRESLDACLDMVKKAAEAVKTQSQNIFGRTPEIQNPAEWLHNLQNLHTQLSSVLDNTLHHITHIPPLNQFSTSQQPDIIALVENMQLLLKKQSLIEEAFVKVRKTITEPGKVTPTEDPETKTIRLILETEIRTARQTHFPSPADTLLPPLLATLPDDITRLNKDTCQTLIRALQAASAHPDSNTTTPLLRIIAGIRGDIITDALARIKSDLLQIERLRGKKDTLAATILTEAQWLAVRLGQPEYLRAFVRSLCRITSTRTEWDILTVLDQKIKRLQNEHQELKELHDALKDYAESGSLSSVRELKIRSADFNDCLTTLNKILLPLLKDKLEKYTRFLVAGHLKKWLKDPNTIPPAALARDMGRLLEEGMIRKTLLLPAGDSPLLESVPETLDEDMEETRFAESLENHDTGQNFRKRVEWLATFPQYFFLLGIDTVIQGVEQSQLADAVIFYYSNHPRVFAGANFTDKEGRTYQVYELKHSEDRLFIGQCEGRPVVLLLYLPGHIKGRMGQFTEKYHKLLGEKFQKLQELGHIQNYEIKE